MIERNSTATESVPMPLSSPDTRETSPQSPSSAIASVMAMSKDYDEMATKPCPTIFPLKSGDSRFLDFLTELDAIPTRTMNSLLVFYLASGQTTLDELLSNSVSNSWSKLQPEFHAFLEAMGSLSPLPAHSGWMDSATTVVLPSDHAKGQLPDGKQQIIYWANATTELVCLCPTDYTFAASRETRKSSAPSSQKATSASDSDGDPTGGRVAVVWLERWEDGPINASADSIEMKLNESIREKFNCPVTIYIHLLSSKLYRIGLLSPPGYVFKAGPVINGLVLSSRCLSSLVRRTVLNISRRRRLASDLFVPPHVKRKYRIAELEQNRKENRGSLVSTIHNGPVTERPEAMLSLFESVA